MTGVPLSEPDIRQLGQIDMSESPQGEDPPRVSDAYSRDLGALLREIRHRSGWASNKLLKKLDWSAGKLSKLESGTRGTGERDILFLLGVLQASKEDREQVHDVLSAGNRHAFVRRHDTDGSARCMRIHEESSVSVIAYEPFTIPPLAQAWDYALALTGSEVCANSRARRKDAARSRATGHQGQRWRFYIHELALRTVVGGKDVMRDQMLDLTLTVGLTNISVNVVPEVAGMDAYLLRPATLMDVGHSAGAVACVEGDSATAFYDDEEIVQEVKEKMCRISAAALGDDESRSLLARWADLYDRGQ
ncbi:helix-turn-helix transcriptional regulator [Saccharothrix sp. BKS2]|uniref:helix-turn-helix domain-containing protein n=1 Tax=Saccharothrix sp. BKS2 TaxID=3064400 RepID=UPI0039EBA159